MLAHTVMIIIIINRAYYSTAQYTAQYKTVQHIFASKLDTMTYDATLFIIRRRADNHQGAWEMERDGRRYNDTNTFGYTSHGARSC